MKRYLITTADEATWKIDRPVLFLGVWCQKFNREKIWSKLDSSLAEPFIENNTVDSDYDYLEVLYNQLLIELTDALNAFACSVPKDSRMASTNGIKSSTCIDAKSSAIFCNLSTISLAARTNSA